MLRKRLDKVPWERFFLIANGPLTLRPYPDPDTCARIWVTLVGALMLLMFPLEIRKHDRIGEHPALAGLLCFALAALGLLLVLAVLMSIRKLRNRPGLSCFSMQYAIGCLRLNMWVMEIFLVASVLSDELYVDDERTFISVLVICLAAVFVLGEAIWNLFVFRRTVSRIEQNKYRPNGPGFWEGEAAWKVLFAVMAIVMFAAGVLPNTRVFWRFAKMLLGMEYGVTNLTVLEMYRKTAYWLTLIWGLAAAATCVLTDFVNARMWVVLYCFRRFGSKYVPPEKK